MLFKNLNAGRDMKDKTIKCQDCGQEFVWTHGEQEFYQSKGLEEPKYCMICRGKHKAMMRDPGREARKTKN